MTMTLNNGCLLVASLLASIILCCHSSLASAAIVARQFTIRPRRSVPPLSPDCFMDKDMLLVNDQNPGPVLRANVGDTIQIQWVNESPSEGVSIHYHGLLMKDQIYADGTGGVSSCTVGPMQTFFHTFVADNAGTHYWHGQTSLDRLDGLQGAIIIDDPTDPEEQAIKEMYDEERLIFLQDWYHRSGPSIRTGLDSEPFIWLGDAQSFLINGKGQYEGCVVDPSHPMCDPECTTKNYLSSISVEAGKTYLFRIINAASLVAVNFAIAHHNMTIVRVEGTYVEPLTLPSLDINVAQRYSVLVTMDQEPDTSYWASTAVRHRGGVQGYASLQYDNAPLPTELDAMPEHINQDMDVGPILDALLASKNITSLPNSDILGEDVIPDRSIVVVGTQTRYEVNNQLRWASNNVSNSLFAPRPLVTMAYDAVKSEDAAPWPETSIRRTIVVPDMPPQTWNYSNSLQDEGISIYHEQNGIAIYKFVKDDVVDMVFQNARALNGVAELHAWHLHGHSLYVIGQGYGTFDLEIDPKSFNLENPLLRDTISVWPLGWTAVRFRADNVGAWPFHCTMPPHAVMGMGFNVITSPDKLSPPPPGLTSCFQTSVNPDDAQVCRLLSDIKIETIPPSNATEPEIEPATEAPTIPTSAPTSSAVETPNIGACWVRVGMSVFASFCILL